MIAIAGIAILFALTSIWTVARAGFAEAKLFPDDTASVIGFSVRAADNGDPDSAWESLTGGALAVEIGDASTSADQFHSTIVGFSYITEATLAGPLIGDGEGLNQAPYEVLRDGAGKFSIELDDMPIFSANVESIEIEPLTIDIRDMTTGASFGYRVSGAGDVHLGTIEISARRASHPSDYSAAYQWWLDASQGQDVKKDLSIKALNREGTVGRQWNFFDCVPRVFHPFGALSPGSNVGTESLTIGCGRVEFVDNARTDMISWINETILARDWKRTVVVKEVDKDGSDGRIYTYIDAFPTRYVFPSFSSSGTGNLYEEITFKPIRMELN